MTAIIPATVFLLSVRLASDARLEAARPVGRAALVGAFGKALLRW